MTQAAPSSDKPRRTNYGVMVAKISSIEEFVGPERACKPQKLFRSLYRRTPRGRGGEARRRAVSASVAACECKRGEVGITKHDKRGLRTGLKLEERRPSEAAGHVCSCRPGRFHGASLSGKGNRTRTLGKRPHLSTPEPCQIVFSHT